MTYGDKPSIDAVLEHHGIKGQKWGVRQFQNEDGTLTEAGKKRYGFNGTGKSRRALNKERNALYFQKRGELDKDLEKRKQEIREYEKKNGKSDTSKKKWYELDDLDTEYAKQAEKYANDKFIEKYGKQTMKKLDSQNSKVAARGKAAAQVALVAIGAVAYSYAKKKEYL